MTVKEEDPTGEDPLSTDLIKQGPLDYGTSVNIEKIEEFLIKEEIDEN